jgi:uracil-DNA glycosylase
MSPAGPEHRPDGPVEPGTGWPDDLATVATPVARAPADVRALAAGAGTLTDLVARQSVCRACPRLVDWRERVAAEKRRSFQSQPYWGRPVPGWGAAHPRVLIVGLAPAAHGGNRTGRIFTGDRSGDVLFASLWRCGLAAQATSIAAGDGQRLAAVRMAAAVRCAPPDNKPSVTERDACAPWLAAEIARVSPDLRVIVCLGHFAWQALWQQLRAAGAAVPRPRPPFGHGAEALLPAPRAGEAREPGADEPGTGMAAAAEPGAAEPGAAEPGAAEPGAGPRTAHQRLLVLGCYHPSQQNTFTGRVTDAMLDAVFLRAREQAGL